MAISQLTLLQQLPHALWDRLLKDMVVELVKQLFPMRSAFKKGCDPLCHRERQKICLWAAATHWRKTHMELGFGTHKVTQCHSRSRSVSGR